MLKFLSIAVLMLLMGCALNPKRVSSLEDRLSRADAEIAKLKEEVSQANQKVTQLESGLRETSSNLMSLEAELNANTDETLRVVVPVLNIRTSPSTVNNNIIAKAEQGAYLRKVVDTEENGQWIKVEFLIDDYPYIGYIFNGPEFVKEEVYDAITFGRIYNRKLIKYQWETEAAMEMRSNNFKTLGVYLKVESPYRSDRFLGYLAKMWGLWRWKLKPRPVWRRKWISSCLIKATLSFTRQCFRYSRLNYPMIWAGDNN
jgi:hypothetical protein